MRQSSPTCTSSRAFVESVHGPGYIEASLLGLNYSYYPLITGSSYAWAGYRPEIELGLHTSGRGDGLAIGFRQGFVFDAFGGSQPRVSRV
jgi:hypothetical protein